MINSFSADRDYSHNSLQDLFQGNNKTEDCCPEVHYPTGRTCLTEVVADGKDDAMNALPSVTGVSQTMPMC